MSDEQPQISDEERYLQFFHTADTDKDGFLSLDELKTTLKSSGYAGTDDQIKAMFQAADDSGDNKVSLEEYMKLMGQIPDDDHKSAAMRMCFRTFDKNGDGQIDRNELSTIFTEMGRYVSPADVDRMIKLADKDASGTLDYNEFITEVFGARSS